MRYLPSLCLIAAAVTACSDGLSPTATQRVPAVLKFYQDPIRLVVPDTVLQYHPFEVLATSYAGGCTQDGGTDVTVQTLTAVVRPYHIEPARTTLCVASLRTINHVATFEFDRTGVASVRILGATAPGQGVVDTSFAVVVVN